MEGIKSMERTSSQNTKMIHVLKAVALSYIITLFLLLLIAFLMLQIALPSAGVAAAVVITYILSVFFGSFYMGKRVEEKRFLWGLITATIYFSVYVIISLIVGGNEAVRIGDYIKTFLIVAFSGMLGGMFS